MSIEETLQQILNSINNPYSTENIRDICLALEASRRFDETDFKENLGNEYHIMTNGAHFLITTPTGVHIYRLEEIIEKKNGKNKRYITPDNLFEFEK